MSEKRFKSPIENALHGCQFGVKLGKIGDTLIGFSPATKVFFRFRLRTSVPNFVEIGSKLRPWEHGQTHTQTDRHIALHTHREITQVILSSVPCYAIAMGQMINVLTGHWLSYTNFITGRLIFTQRRRTDSVFVWTSCLHLHPIGNNEWLVAVIGLQCYATLWSDYS